MRYESRARLWKEEFGNIERVGPLAKSHLLQVVANDEEAFAGQNLLLHGHRVLQQLHDEGQQSATAKKQKKRGNIANERERERFRLD